MKKILSNKAFVTVLFVVVFFTAMIGFAKVYTYFAIDDCLDAGGQWSYKTSSCNK